MKNESRFVFENTYQEAMYYSIKLKVFDGGPVKYSELVDSWKNLSSWQYVQKIHELNRLIEIKKVKVIPIKEEDEFLLLPI